jgi:hypothetical protein
MRRSLTLLAFVVRDNTDELLGTNGISHCMFTALKDTEMTVQFLVDVKMKSNKDSSTIKGFQYERKTKSPN